MALTVIGLPKPFQGIYGIIQTNAIQSWASLPNTSVLLFGNESGVASIAHSLPNCTHIPSITRNHLGTPLLNDMFQQGSQLATTNWMVFANSDIVIHPNLPDLIQHLQTQISTPFVLVARRWDIPLDDLIDFTNSEWHKKLLFRFEDNKSLYGTNGMDLFVFPRYFYDSMPPFSLGWPGAKYDNWLVWYARSQQIPVIDITHALTTFHQVHPKGGGATHPDKWEEHFLSLKYLGGYGNCYDIRDASHWVSSDWKIAPVKLRYSMIPVYIKRWVQRLRDRFLLK